MKVYPLVIFYLFCLNCSSSDNSFYDNSPPNDPDPIGVVQEEVFYISQNIDGSNVSREVLLHLPESFDNTQTYPVVIAFHGNGGQNDGWISRFSHFVDNGEFIGVYPQGYLNSWNLGREASTADDVDFFNQIMAQLETYSFFDASRVYGIGSSNGSAMINKLAIETPHFTAVAALASQLMVGTLPDSSTAAVSVLQICGAADNTIPYEGGMAFMGHHFLGAHESALTWANAFHCNTEPVIEMMGVDQILTYIDCGSGKEIKFHSIENGGHNLNAPNDPLFFHRIWDFLKRF
jgi:polyhydroxybutyrate depolymerase